jgi:dGTPase
MERREDAELAPYATRSYPAHRRLEEPDCGLRTPFQRDRDRIVHSKAFRRLKHKTHVFVAPVGDHYRTRLTHTLEVTQVARTIARALGLNEDLVEAICLGHDLGHTPFGHIGEKVLNECLDARGAGHFWHNENSLRIVDVLEGDGAGLNLTAEVRNGILAHSWRAKAPVTAEGMVMRMGDRIAYINADIDDAIRAGLLAKEDLPREPIAVLGETGPRRIDKLVHDLVEHSAAAGEIVQGEEARAAMDALRDFMFANVYLGPEVTRQGERIEYAIRTLFDHYCEHPEQIPDSIPPSDSVELRVTDYISGMTDSFCTNQFVALTVPTAFNQ